jgi:hypothetical protein
MKRGLMLLALVGVVLFSAAPVLSEFYVVGGGGAVGTKINSVPYTITQPGFYYLGKNFTSTGTPAISIEANGVTLDLMGFSLIGNGTNKGIYMSGRKNVEIRNGCLQNFSYGIQEESATGVRHRVINVRVEGNNTYLLDSYGISLQGNAHLVKGCTAWGSNTGISISNGTVSGCQVEGCKFGISMNGAGNMIGNVVVVGASPAAGILGGDLMLDQNTVFGDGTHYDVFGGGAQWGTNVGQ